MFLSSSSMYSGILFCNYLILNSRWWVVFTKTISNSWELFVLNTNNIDNKIFIFIFIFFQKLSETNIVTLCSPKSSWIRKIKFQSGACPCLRPLTIEPTQALISVIFVTFSALGCIFTQRDTARTYIWYI